MKRKKFLCLIFILMMVSGILTVSSFATEDIPINEENFPNSYFRNFVIDNFDKDGNGMLSEAEVKAVTKINCSAKGFFTMEGIEFFTELTNLDCSYNHLISLDLSKNTELLELDCSENNLTSLDISQNTELRELDCSENQLTSLDISKNTGLTTLYCSSNQLTTLDVSNNTSWFGLHCYS